MKSGHMKNIDYGMKTQANGFPGAGTEPGVLRVLEQTFSVDFNYPVVFTRDVWNPDNPVLRDSLLRRGGPAPHKAMVFLDSGVADAHPGLRETIRAYADTHAGVLTLADDPIVVAGGERIKNDMVGFRDILHRLSRSGLCRHSFVIVMGGGAVLDAVGFATSLVHRGLRLIRIPTTVLAQNDAGIGVKNGLNTDSGKNTIGVFSPPFAVLNDLSVLRTLTDRDWIAGAAEAFKVAIIKDRMFFHSLLADASALRRRDPQAMERLILRCAELHLEHIRSNGDPFEMGEARPLDFGHWSAHKLESLSGFQWLHGEAVAIGISLDSAYAARMGWISREEFQSILDGLRGCGLPVWAGELELRGPGGARLILDGLRSFREHLGGELCLTFPMGLGARREERTLDLPKMEASLQDLRAAAEAGPVFSD
jgi:3-dehydroquinate synthase